MSKKFPCLLISCLVITLGCGTPSVAPGTHASAPVVKTAAGGAILPSGVSLPPAAVQAGATKSFESKK